MTLPTRIVLSDGRWFSEEDVVERWIHNETASWRVTRENLLHTRKGFYVLERFSGSPFDEEFDESVPDWVLNLDERVLIQPAAAATWLMQHKPDISADEIPSDIADEVESLRL